MCASAFLLTGCSRSAFLTVLRLVCVRFSYITPRRSFRVTPGIRFIRSGTWGTGGASCFVPWGIISCHVLVFVAIVYGDVVEPVYIPCYLTVMCISVCCCFSSLAVAGSFWACLHRGNFNFGVGVTSHWAGKLTYIYFNQDSF